MLIENTQAPQASVPRRLMAWGLTGVLWLGILLAYHEQVALVLQSWETMPSHAHGYVVLVVVTYFVWGKRHALASLPQVPSGMGLAALAVAAIAALAGQLVSAASVVQFAVVFMLQAAAWAVMGNRIFRVLFGPLCFLFFAIPFGHDILPTLMDWTADATVMGLRASGVPVFQENRFFIIPSGSWSVIEACSGVRYLLTSFFVGSIFAYVTYSRWYKRLVFVLWMLLLSLFANWLRAYVIVMAAHLSNNEWGLGLSHLAFGWVIFAIVVVVSFAVGSRWHDVPPARQEKPSGIASPVGRTVGSAIAAALLILGVAQTAGHVLNKPARPAPALDLATVLGDLEKVQHARPMIVPKFIEPSALYAANYRFGEGEVGVTVAYYRNQKQGAELINYNNVLEPSQKWTWNRSQHTEATASGVPGLRVENYVQREMKAVVATVYWVGGYTTTSQSASKLYQAINLLRGKGDDAAMLVITATEQQSPEAAMELVKAFVREKLPRILKYLDFIQTEQRS